MVKFNKLKDCVVTNKNVILRVDINVPIKNGKIIDDTRIRAVIPTIEYLAKNNAKVILISHFGRPEGRFNEEMSLKQLVEPIQKILGKIKLNFVDDCVGEKVEAAVKNTNYGEVAMLENLRFYKEETKNDSEFSRKLASLGNLYVNDAFSCSHRAHASITGIPAILKSAAGFLMQSELENLTNLLENAKLPMIAAVAGAKISTKIDLLNSLIKKAQTVVVAGAMANTFLFANGKNVGKSLCEKDLKDTALEIMKAAKACGCKLILPSDVVVTKNLVENSESFLKSVDDVKDDEIIADIGSKTVENLVEELENHKTLIWNGPFGAFEIKPFDAASINFAKAAADLTQKNKLISVAGGGDVVAAINSANLFDKFSYISTAGGAFLEWLEGKALPGIAALSCKF